MAGPAGLPAQHCSLLPLASLFGAAALLIPLLSTARPPAQHSSALLMVAALRIPQGTSQSCRNPLISTA
eukprot:280829-Chlamydomonas_euryale.AAC.3